jgi:Ser/Thr protein kinase RdoA (MazF antagonist)
LGEHPFDHVGHEVPTDGGSGDVPPPRLLRRWDLDEPRTIVPVAADSADSCGATARGWRLATDAAAFLLKDFTGVERRRIVFRHRVTNALADAGLPVPTPIATRDGRSLVTADGRRYALYPWVAGQRRGGLELSLTQCHELGELLGRVHAALDALTPPVQQTLLIPTSRASAAVADVDALLRDLPYDRDDYRCRSTWDDFDALAARRLRERRALLTEFADHQPPEMDTAMVGYVHGDFHAGNLVYGRVRRVTAIVGWGRLTIAPYGGELARAAVLLFGHPDERGLDLERVEAFVAGHAAAFPLDGGQIQSAVHRLWWERLCDVAALRRRYLDHDRGAPGAAGLITWWTEHLERTLDVFAAPYAEPAARLSPP